MLAHHAGRKLEPLREELAALKEEVDRVVVPYYERAEDLRRQIDARSNRTLNTSGT